jgi:hypothetical protein
MQGAALIGNIYTVVVLMFIHATTVIAVLMCSSAVDVRDGTIGVTMSVGDTRHRAGELGDEKEPNEPGNKLVPAPKQHDDNLLPTGNANLAGFSHAVNAMGTWREQVGCSAFFRAFAGNYVSPDDPRPFARYRNRVKTATPGTASSRRPAVKRRGLPPRKQTLLPHRSRASGARRPPSRTSISRARVAVVSRHAPVDFRCALPHAHDIFPLSSASSTINRSVSSARTESTR